MKKNRISLSYITRGLAVLALVATAGCGDKSGDGSGADPTRPAAKKSASSIAEVMRTMTGAAIMSDIDAAQLPVAMRFDLKSRPEPGKPLVVDIAFLPRHPSPRLAATFLSGAGITLQPSAIPADYANVEAEAVYRHELTVVPADNGVYSVSAIVQIEQGGIPVVHTFAIPILVGPPPA